MGESDQTTRPRRKRIGNSTTKNGIVSSIDELNTAVNGIDLENGSVLDNSSPNSSKSQSNGVSRSATRRKRIQKAKPGKLNKKSNSALIIIALIGAAYFIGYVIGIAVEKYWLNVPLPTLVEMKQSRSCDVIFSSQRPLYSEDDWQYPYEIYGQVSSKQ